MKILCFIYSLGPGGAERVLTHLATDWAEKGNQVTIATYDKGDDPFYALSAKVRLIKLRLSGGNILLRLINHLKRPFVFRKIIKKLSPDVVISFMDKTNVLVLMAKSGVDIPVIISERTDFLKYYPGTVVSLLRPFFYKRAQALVTLSQVQAQYFRKFCRRVVIIANPVIPLKYSLSSNASKREPNILAAGRLSNEKGFDLLLRAFSNIHASIPDWNLVIYGKGPDRKNLERLVHNLRIQKRVKLAGITKDLPKVMSKAGIFVLSSRYEGFPNVLIEAMAAGCPVIATDCADSIRDIITHQKNGLLIPPENIEALEKAIKLLLTNESLRKKLGKEAQKSIKKFSLKKISRKWEHLMAEAIRDKRKQFS